MDDLGCASRDEVRSEMCRQPSSSRMRRPRPPNVVKDDGSICCCGCGSVGVVERVAQEMGGGKKG